MNDRQIRAEMDAMREHARRVGGLLLASTAGKGQGRTVSPVELLDDLTAMQRRALTAEDRLAQLRDLLSHCELAKAPAPQIYKDPAIDAGYKIAMGEVAGKLTALLDGAQ